MADSRRLTTLAERVAAALATSLTADELGGTSRLAVGLSGGADSAVLGWALVQQGITPTLIHVDHGWPNSAILAQAAHAIGDELGLPLTIRRVDTDAPGSPEAVAREARYAALLEAADGDVVATAHTATDQAETLVGNVMWGSGLDGLRGIRRRTDSLVRPLLDISRAEVRELATLRQLPFVDDPANDETRFRRVRIRRALAEWEHRLAPGITSRLASLADLVSADLELLRPDESLIRQEGNAVSIPAGVLNTVPAPTAARLIRSAIRSLTGVPGTRLDVDKVLDVVGGAKATEIAGGHRVTRVDASVRIGDGSKGSPPAMRWDLRSDRRWGSWAWTVQRFNGRPDVYPLTRYAQVFDAAYVGDGPVVIRSVAKDDRLTMRTGSKDARQALMEAGVASPQRVGWPVMELGGDVAWVPGIRRADAGWVSSDTRRYLVITAQWEGSWKQAES